MAKKKEAKLSPEERMQQAMVPEEEWPYELPEGWKWVRLGSVCSFIGGGTPSKAVENYWNGNIPWASVKDIKGQYLTGTQDHISAEGLRNSSSNLCEPGDLLLITRIEPGRTIISNIECAVNQDLKIIKTSQNKKYLHFYFECFAHWFEEKSSGSTVKGISIKNVYDMPYPLAPEHTQSLIADFIEQEFQRLDEAQKQIQSVIDSAEERKQSMLENAFTGKLTEKWRRESNIPFEKWRKEKLKTVCEVNPKKEDISSLPDDLEVSFFPMASVDEKTGTITNPQVRMLKDVKTGFSNFKEGDVVFAKITPCMENGKSAVIKKLVNNIGYGTTEFYVLRCGERINKDFLFHLVRSYKFRSSAKQEMTGAVGQQRVPKKYLEDYEVYLPTIDEQKEIVRLLNSFFTREDMLIDTAEKTMIELRKLQMSIVSEAFRGKLIH